MLLNEGILLRDSKWLSDKEAEDYISASVLNREAREFRDTVARMKKTETYYYVWYGVAAVVAIILAVVLRSVLAFLFVGGAFGGLLGILHARHRRALNALEPLAALKSVKRVRLLMRNAKLAGRTVTLSLCGLAPTTDFDYHRLSDNRRLRAILDDLELVSSELKRPLLTNTSRVNIGKDSDYEVFSYDAEKRALELLTELGSILAAPVVKRVALPAMKPDSDILGFLAKHGRSVTSPATARSITTIDGDALARQIAEFDEFIAQEKEAMGATDLDSAIETALSGFESLCGVRAGSFDRAINVLKAHRTVVSMHTLNSAFAFFCQSCNKDFFGREDYERYQFNANSMMRYDYGELVWRCPLCGMSSELPIAVPRVYVELLFPMVDILLKENRIARLAMYHDTERQKVQNLANAQRETREIERGGAGRLEELLSGINRLKAELDSEKEAVVLITSLMAGMAAKSRERMGRIDAAAQQTLNRINSYSGRQVSDFRSELAAGIARADQDFRRQARVARVAEERRDAQFAALARNTQRLSEVMERTSKEQTEAMRQVGQTIKTSSRGQLSTLRRMEKHQRNVASVQIAEADKRGDLNKFFLFHPVYTARKGFNDVVTTLTGGSRLDRASKNSSLQ